MNFIDASNRHEISIFPFYHLLIRSNCGDGCRPDTEKQVQRHLPQQRPMENCLPTYLFLFLFFVLFSLSTYLYQLNMGFLQTAYRWAYLFIQSDNLFHFDRSLLFSVFRLFLFIDIGNMVGLKSTTMPAGLCQSLCSLFLLDYLDF